MRRFFVRSFAAIGMLVVATVVATIALAIWESVHTTHVADNTVVSLDLSSGFPDGPPANGLTELVSPGRPPLRDVLDAIDRAADDPRVTALVARIGDGDMGLAQVQELRDAIAAFRAKGKPAIAYADTFGEFGTGTKSYYLAAAFNDIWLQPLGSVGLVGLRAEEPFFRGTLDMLGVVPRFDHREDYKSALDPLTEKTMTGPDREQLQALLDSVYGQIVHGIAVDRKLDDATVRALVDRGPLLTKEALDAHLIDHIGYSDDALAAAGVPPRGSKHPLPFQRYLAAAGRPHHSGPTIALIYANGLITRGDEPANPISGPSGVEAGPLIRAFRLAERDPDVRAILFRVDSPGGSAVASESIWRATVEAKQAGKKLIVSMGDVAGSGGYYIAAAADKIVAEPATLTGSIGVVAGKVLLNGLLAKLDAGVSAVQVGADAALSSPFEDFSPEGYKRFEAFLDDIYAGFKSRVAEGRKLDAAAVEAVAKGRIWSGEDAKAHGLVDELGGFATALAAAKEAAGIPAGSDVTIKLFPPSKSPLRRLVDRALGRSADDDESALARSFAALQPLIAQLSLLTAPPRALLMAPIDLK